MVQSWASSHGGTGSKRQDKAEKGELLGDEAFEKGTEGPAGLQDGMEECGGGCVTVWDWWVCRFFVESVSSNACTLSQFHKIECEAVKVQHSQTNKPFHKKHQMSMFK